MGRGHGNYRVDLEIGVESTGEFYELIYIHGGLKVWLGSLQRGYIAFGRQPSPNGVPQSHDRQHQ